jgi:hypothetical protein
MDMNISSALTELRLAPPLILDPDQLHQWKTEVLKPTYRAWMKAVHPDVNRHESANRETARISEAYQRLEQATIEDLGAKPKARVLEPGNRHRVRMQPGDRARFVVRVPMTSVRIGVFW